MGARARVGEWAPSITGRILAGGWARKRAGERAGERAGQREATTLLGGPQIELCAPAGRANRLRRRPCSVGFACGARNKSARLGRMHNGTHTHTVTTSGGGGAHKLARRQM